MFSVSRLLGDKERRSSYRANRAIICEGNRCFRVSCSLQRENLNTNYDLN